MTSLPHMTCDECRQIIAVADLTDWGDMDAVAAHCRTCDGCAGVVTEVRDSARRVAELLDGIPAGVSSSLVARRAAAAAAIERQERRRRRVFLYPVAGGAATLALVALLVSRSGMAGRETHHVLLRCLTVDQAAALVTPVLGRDGRVAGMERGMPGVRMLTLSGKRSAVAEAERVIDQVDHAGPMAPDMACDVPVIPPELNAAVLEQDRMRAEQEAERARQEVDRIRQEVERARQEAERARQEALAHRP